LADVRGCKVVAKEKGNRAGCRCSEARDIGEYDTCPHGCVYCYAVQNRPLALDRYKSHDPDSEFLFPLHGTIEGPTEPELSAKRVQLSLFDRLEQS
jgi:hypothetical protein